jgi:AraC-like DNA-binding protein
MYVAPPTVSMSCPDPFERAPRVGDDGASARQRLYLAPASLRGAVAAIVCRDTRGAGFDSAQRLSHFPATPLVCLSWFQGVEAGLVERAGDGPRWRPFGAAAVLSGSQSQPTVSWTSTGGWGGMICFTADAAQALFGIDWSLIHDRFIPAEAVLGAAWQPLLQSLVEAADDAAALAALERHLAPRWRALQGGASPWSSLRMLGRHWVARMALQSREWRATHSPRQVERRIKAHSGRSLRQWQALVKTEGAFFAARERYEAGLPLEWAVLAQEEGFADQAHFSRATKRITGFAPGEFARRFAEDESFWIYRLWV